MRILVLSPKLPYPPKDGGAIATLCLSEGLAAHGHSITIMAMNTSKHYYDASELPCFNNIKFITVDVNTDINYLKALYNLLFSRMPYNATRFISQEYTLNLIELLKKEEFDIIQIEGLYLCLYIPLLRNYSKAKISYRSHNIEYEIWQRICREEINVFKRWYLRILTKRIKHMEIQNHNKYDCLVPISQVDAYELNRMGNTKPQCTIQFGINDFHPRGSSDEVEFSSLFYIGALDWTPNQSAILWFIEHVWLKLRNENSQLKFYISGRNAPKWFQHKLKSYPVEYVGEVENARDFMLNKAIMVVPLFSGSGMRVKIIQGMALGKVIVTTSIGAEGIECRNQEHLVIANTADDFMQAISALLADRQLYNRIAENAHTFVKENFDNFTLTKKLSDFYNGLLHVD
jgi:polysaccharide biosynthesis protein PslH